MKCYFLFYSFQWMKERDLNWNGNLYKTILKILIVDNQFWLNAPHFDLYITPITKCISLDSFIKKERNKKVSESFYKTLSLRFLALEKKATSSRPRLVDCSSPSYTIIKKKKNTIKGDVTFTKACVAGGGVGPILFTVTGPVWGISISIFSFLNPLAFYHAWLY